MHYKLLGFSQNGSLRRFVFTRVDYNRVSGTFAVVADLALAQKFRITLQELPSICSRLVESGAGDQPAATMFLTNVDFEMCAAANLATEREEQGKRAREKADAARIRAENARLLLTAHRDEHGC